MEVGGFGKFWFGRTEVGPLDLVFALDIGTRKVAGVVLAVEGHSQFRLRAHYVEEHQERSMLDGQIQDIPRVAEVVERVKKALEAKVGQLRQVSIAAAGRSLLTAPGSASMPLGVLEPVSSEQLLTLELEAVQAAQNSLKAKQGSRARDLYCVGHTVKQQFLDGNPIRSLLGQRGKEARIEVIATFLPVVVVESLYEVVSKSGLEVKTLTLEPIAALSVIVPPDLRGLNLALVDIGAGTSDIAITREGTVVGYGMVPWAGDEITEHICQELLVDFPTGEKIKRSAGNGLPAVYRDVLGAEASISPEDLTRIVSPAVYRLASEIAEGILEINGAPPQAVLCVGGGSLTPGLTTQLAECLGLSANRVAVRGSESISMVRGLKRFKGPEAVTPIGIAVTGWTEKGSQFNSVLVNGRPVRTFALNSKVKVAQVLMDAGVSRAQIWGEPGPSLGVRVNGQLVFLRGQPGKPAQITLNGKPARLEDEVKPGDRIEIVPGQRGKPGSGTVADVLPDYRPKHLVFNHRPVKVEPLVKVNGVRVSPGFRLFDGAVVEYRPLSKVADVLEAIGKSPEDYWRHFRLRLDGQWMETSVLKLDIKLNQQAADPNSPVEEGDKLEVAEETRPVVVGDLLKRVLGGPDSPDADPQPVQVTVNGKPVCLSQQVEITINGELASTLDVPVHPQDQIVIRSRPRALILADILDQVDLSSQAKGKGKLILTVNGEPAEFTTPIASGDEVVVKLG